MRDRVRQAIARHIPTEIPLEGLRDSAVLLLLHHEADEERLLFQVRSRSLALHSGEIGFPGGTRHAQDGTLLDTALREVEEEIGVPRAEVEVFGQLDDALTHSSSYRIRPFAGALAHGPREFALDASEVHELLSIPLDFLRSPEARGWYPVDRGGVMEATPAFIYGEYVIWGATARVLEHYLALIEAPAGTPSGPGVTA
ncbi:MAG: CoA pyrophosphatase [Dehalococcoidia bacterium]